MIDTSDGNRYWRCSRACCQPHKVLNHSLCRWDVGCGCHRKCFGQWQVATGGASVLLSGQWGDTLRTRVRLMNHERFSLRFWQKKVLRSRRCSALILGGGVSLYVRLCTYVCGNAQRASCIILSFPVAFGSSMPWGVGSVFFYSLSSLAAATKVDVPCSCWSRTVD